MMNAAVLQPGLGDDPQWRQLKAWIIQRTGLSYYNQRDEELRRALQQVFDPEGELPPAHKLLARLQSCAADLDALVEQLTIGETFFFRHLEMFNALRDSVFPDLLLRRAASRRLRIWSAGCSIGAEPYSIAILLRDLLGAQFQNWSIQILGTDINRKFLRIAEEGAYDPWALRGVPPHVLHRSFTKEGKKWRLADRCREGVTFRSHNLATDPLPDPMHDMAGFDLIICRNVMIYFDLPSIQKLARQFYETLSPGSWLAVGHAEPHTSTFSMFRTVNTAGAILYQRLAAGDAAGFAPAPVETAWKPPVVKHIWPVLAPLAVPTPALIAVPAPMVRMASPVAPQASHGSLAEIMQLADAGDLQKALQACDALILKEPLSAGAHYYHGMILYQYAEWAAADKSLRRCLYLAHNLALAHFYLGLVQERRGQPSQRHFANARDLLVGQPADAPVPLGQGLTVREFRSLLTVPEHAVRPSLA